MPTYALANERIQQPPGEKEPSKAMMNSFEKVDRAMDSVMPEDRSQIPLMAQFVTFPAHYAGIKQKDAFYDVDLNIKAYAKVFAELGKPDCSYYCAPGDAAFGEELECYRPGSELADDDATYQFHETQRMDIDDYQDILDHGWNQWHTRYLMSIQHPALERPEQLGAAYAQMGQRIGVFAGWLASQGVAPITDIAVMPPFDSLSLFRSFMPFTMDLYDEPDLVKAVCDKAADEMIEGTLKNAKANAHVHRIGLFAMRSDCDTLSPDLFDEFAWPTLSRMILAFDKAGFKSVIHADSNWLPILDRFLKLPAHCVSFELDGKTDIFKAAQILDGWQSFRGDVPATTLAFGTPDDVFEYCEKLITEIGLKTPGFILGSGCEIPFNAKPENVKALLTCLGNNA